MPRIRDPKIRREQSEINAKAMRKARLAATLPGSPFIPKQKAKINIGCSGWYYWHWRGKFYPEELSTNKWFSHYANHFNTVELNAPFYSWPTVTTVKSWIRQAKNSSMNYSVKVSELITHARKFKNTSLLVKDFYFIAQLLGDRLGCFLFQLPPSYQYTKARLKNIVKQLNPHMPNVVEFRHSSWWNEEVYSAFKKANITFCSCSSPKLPEDLIKTSDRVYIRFHGKNKMYRHDYSLQELKEWVTKIKKSKAKELWIYFNNDFESFAVKNATQLYQLLQKK